MSNNLQNNILEEEKNLMEELDRYNKIDSLKKAMASRIVEINERLSIIASIKEKEKDLNNKKYNYNVSIKQIFILNNFQDEFDNIKDPMMKSILLYNLKQFINEDEDDEFKTFINNNSNFNEIKCNWFLLKNILNNKGCIRFIEYLGNTLAKLKCGGQSIYEM